MLCNLCIESGGFLHPLLLPKEKIIGPSLTNPSVFVNKNNEILINLRNINYTLYHSENGVFEHSWGPLCYLHQENDQRLATNNILCKLDNNLNIISNNIVDTSFLDEDPLWTFVGLEDARLVEWDNKLYISGVRRDTTTNGQGRMELSEIIFKNNKVLEKERIRIPAPKADNSYCEKNWMPVLNRPYTYVKWTNSTEVVEVDPKNKTCETIILTNYKNINTRDLRGGSQVIFLNNKYLALVHEVNLFRSETGKKNAVYTHRFVVWDQNFELLEVSDSFSFLDAKIEFCCGIAEHKDHLLISFGFQDNAAFLLGMPKNLLGKYLKNYE
jgi:predicted GH43/DUF377 family glycosyl hydrolase